MFQKYVRKLHVVFHKLLLGKEGMAERESEKIARKRKGRLKLLKEALPEEWEAYEEYVFDWASNGIMMLRLPTFEEFIANRPIEVGGGIKSLLAGVGCSA